MSQAEQGPSQLPCWEGTKRVPVPQKATLVEGKAPRLHSKGGCEQEKWGGKKKGAKSSTQTENGEGERRAPAGWHGDPLPEAEAAEEEEGERAKAASRCGDGRFFHMAATPRYGHPGPIPVAYK